MQTILVIHFRIEIICEIHETDVFQVKLLQFEISYTFVLLKFTIVWLLKCQHTNNDFEIQYQIQQF